MKLADLNAESSLELWIKSASSDLLPNQGIGTIRADRSLHIYRMKINGQLWKICLRDTSEEYNLNFHLQRGSAHLVEITQVAKDGTACIKIVFFNGEIIEMGSVDIGVDNRIELTAKKNGMRFNNFNELGELLLKKLSFQVDDESYFCMFSGKSATEDFDYSENGEIEMNIDEQMRSFSLSGERISIPVEKRKLSSFDEFFYASKLIFKNQQLLNSSLRLARGNLKFSSTPERIKAIAAGSMSQLTKQTGSYLKQWDEYGAIEGEILLSKAKAVGVIEYNNVEQTTKGVKFFAPSIPEQLNEGDSIEITSELPLYLKNPDLTWDEYSKALEEEFKSKIAPQKKISDERKESTIYPNNATILSLSANSIELELPSIPSKKVFLILSINGDKVQIERRMRARSAILESRSANPLLGLIIEEEGILPDIQRVTKLKPLTSFVKKKIFKHAPTDRQVKAIDVALNTPDIALIQGPPGTGKTTVVTAILERLNEEYDKTKSIKGQILVSGFQHDAVENIISRLSINALPSVKFGKKSGSEFTEDAVTGKINKWCSNLSEQIRTRNPQITKTEEQVKLAELFATYSLNPSQNNTVNLMNRILNLPRDVIADDRVKESKRIIKSIERDLKLTDYLTLRLIRALRVTEAGFLDDGSVRALDLWDKIEDEQDDLDLSALYKAARWNKNKSLDFLFELKTLKETLLQQYLPKPVFRTEKPREDVLKLVASVSQDLENQLNSKNKRDAILANFLHELEDNPDGVREALQDYNFVYAATTQQAVGKDIIRSKNKYVRFDQRTEIVKYDTVIIDEAARTSPRDLLIPMSMAEKRIILVGDHRQLPHLIDEEVARALESDDSTETSNEADFVKKSMFEYLFKRLKKLEEKDGITRTVTLDAQYRTHPLLGDFASQNFYDKYGEGYRSPLPENFFSQNLSGIENKAAVWINVPNNRGREERKGTSRIRISEAQIIAEYISKWINSDEGMSLSFGVISFYKAQVYAVFEALQQYGVTEKGLDGGWQVQTKYRFLKEGEERLRIGTVDSFQGMEFDVVFLSTVRTQDIPKLEQTIQKSNDYSRIQQSVFGHLMSDNRLCVSMSRQKKVLAIVGDGDLVNTQVATDSIPALKNFYDLCSQKGVIK